MSLQGAYNYSASQSQQFAGLPSLYSVPSQASSAPSAPSTREDSVYAAPNSPVDQFTARYTMPTDTTWGQSTSGGDAWYQTMQASLSGSFSSNTSTSPSSSVNTPSGASTPNSWAQGLADRALTAGSWDDMAASALVRQTVDTQNKPVPMDPSQSEGYQKLMALAQQIQSKRASQGFVFSGAQDLAKQQQALEQAATRALIADQIDKTIPAESQLGAMVRQIVSDALQYDTDSPQFGQIMGQLTALARQVPDQAAQLDDVAMVVKDATLVRLISSLNVSQTGLFGTSGNAPRIEALKLERESLADRRALNQMLSTSNPVMNSLRGIVGEILAQKNIQASALDTLESRFKQAAEREPLARALAPKAYLLVLEIVVNQQILTQSGTDVSALKARKSLITDLYKQPNLTFDQLAAGMSKAPDYTPQPTSGFNMTQLMMMMALSKRK